MPRPRTLLALAAALAAGAPAGCKNAATQKTQLGPFTADRYQEQAADGSRLDCYVLGADSNKPARLCGDATPTPGFTGLLFHAEAPAAGSRFTSAVGEPLPSGWYIVKPAGSSAVDAWPLGRMALREWLGGGKALLGIEATGDHHTHVRIIDPQGRAERNVDVGPMRAGDNFLLARAPADESVLLIQRLGGNEMVLVRDPLNNPEVAVADASDEKSAGNRKFHERGEKARQNGGQFVPSASDLGSISWKGGSPLYDGAALGPFDAPNAGRQL